MPNRLVEIIDRQAARIGEREAYRFCWRKEGEWLSTSWSEFALQVKVAAKALATFSLDPQDRIAICSPNSPQILITEFGAYRNRLACIPIYPNSSQAQFDFIVKDGGARFIFVGDSHQYALAYRHWKSNPDIKKIVIFKNDGLQLEADDTVSIFWDDFVRLGMDAPAEIQALVDQHIDQSRGEDIATLIYTSGTTGQPKGVMITHDNYDAAIQAHLDMLHTIKDDDLSMSFLPMCHILEKAWCYFLICRGITIAVNYDPRVITETIQMVHPTLMCCVPRFWEKVYAAVKEKLEEMSWIQRAMVSRALKVGKRRNLKYQRRGIKAPFLLEKEYQFWDHRLFSILKKAVGIPNPNFYPTAGAAISDSICEFFHSIGINVLVGYGLSETTATVSCFPYVDYQIGTVGRPISCVDVRIDDNGEILVKGPTVTPGYYNNPEANRLAFTSDGYFRTGDAGYLTEQGHIVLTERVKDLFKTANGKYVAPQQMESRLVENKYIEEVTVIGDRRKFVSALVVPCMPQLCEWATSQGINPNDPHLLDRAETVRFVMSEIEKYQQDLAGYERIKRITLLNRPFSLEDGEITNTLKVKRSVVAKHFADRIEQMYSDKYILANER